MESKVVRRLVVGSIARLDVGLIWRWFLHEVSCGDVCRFVPLASKIWRIRERTSK